jgi:type IV fimbrial biogenesis protein FimT
MDADAKHKKERHMDQDGKTLMELMIVMALVGILTAMASPNFLHLKSRMDIHSTAQEIASELRLARQIALTQRERIRFVIDLEQQLIAVQFVNRGTTYRTYRYGGTGISIDEPSAGPEIIFHPSGRSATATTIRLRAQDGQVHKLTVGITGRVSVL